LLEFIESIPVLGFSSSLSASSSLPLFSIFTIPEDANRPVAADVGEELYPALVLDGELALGSRHAEVDGQELRVVCAVVNGE